MQQGCWRPVRRIAAGSAGVSAGVSADVSAGVSAGLVLGSPRQLVGPLTGPQHGHGLDGRRRCCYLAAWWCTAAAAPPLWRGRRGGSHLRTDTHKQHRIQQSGNNSAHPCSYHHV